MRASLRLRNASTMFSGRTLKPSPQLLERVRRPAMLKKLAHPDDLAPLFKVSPFSLYRSLETNVHLFSRLQDGDYVRRVHLPLHSSHTHFSDSCRLDGPDSLAWGTLR